jgi:DNA primase
MKLPQSFIEEIKSRLRISEVIGSRLSLKRAGREYHALCPFHKEKTPSFTINDEKGFYHCFGCGAHGDVIGFIKEYERIGYLEAVERLAGQAGLAMPKLSREAQAREDRVEGLQGVVEACCSWFEQQLEQSAEGEIARKYLRERGLSEETVARFRLGYALSDREALKKAMLARGISEAQLVETGMLIAVEGRAPYSRFRRRLMFPIRDRKSRVVAFGGRVLPGEPQADAPKYLNSPETPLFHKGRMLFNYDTGRRAGLVESKLVIAEGYMDVIAMVQAGFAYAVAPLGTAITPEQLQLAWQIAPEPVLCLDGDNAGARAMQRAMQLALPLLVPGKTLRVARLPAGEDPDSLIRRAGKLALEQVLTQASGLAEVLWQHHTSSPASSPEARAAQEEALMRAVTEIKHPSVQHYYKQAMRERLRGWQQQSAPRPAGQKAARGEWQKAPHTLPQHSAKQMMGMIVVDKETEARLEAPLARMLALVVLEPQLLEDASAEEAWLCAPVTLPHQQKLHRAVSEALFADPEILVHNLWSQLRDDVPEALPMLEKAALAMGFKVHAEAADQPLNAARLWPQVMNDVSRVQLEGEFKEAEQALAHDMTQENFERLALIKKQLDALNAERTRLYREDPLVAKNQA